MINPLKGPMLANEQVVLHIGPHWYTLFKGEVIWGNVGQYLVAYECIPVKEQEPRYMAQLVMIKAALELAETSQL